MCLIDWGPLVGLLLTQFEHPTSDVVDVGECLGVRWEKFLRLVIVSDHIGRDGFT